MTKKPDAPAIRFKGFSDAWEQRKLSEMCGTFEYGLNAAAKEFDGKNKYIRITDIDDASREFLLSDLSSPDICLDGMSKYLLSSGDIVFARTGASVGKTYIYRENDGIVYFAGFLIRAKVNQDNDAEFVFQSTLSPSYEKYIRITSQRSGQPGVNAQEYGEYDLFAPSKEEQQRIGHFLRGIDNLITLHQRQPFLHSSPDISLIVQLTPPFYTFSWEQRKFSEITFLSGEKNRENLPLESYSITNESGFVPQDEKFENGGTMREANKRMYYIVSQNSFAYNPARINVGSIGYQNTGKNVIVSSLYEIFKTSDDVDDRLLWHWFKSPDFQKLIWQLQEGGVRLYFYYDKLCMGEVSLPSLEEQRKIGKFFDTLDNLITLHQRQPFLHSSPDISLIVQLTPPFYTFSWEQRKLTEFVEFFSGLTYTPNDVQENGTLVLRSSNVSNGEVVDADNIYVNPQVVNSENVKVGDIVVVVRNGSRSLIGKHAQIKAFMPNTVIGAFMTGIRSECPEFTNALLNTSRFEEEIAMNMGATINQITGYMFSKMEFKVPCLDEQKKIGEYFEKLDNLITLHQRQAIVYAVIRSIRKVILAERQYFAPPMVRKSP